jgi:hypothetical protein
MKKLIVLLAALFIPLAALPALAAQVRVFVTELNAVGVQNRDEMKVTLQTLLASRLTGDRIVTVGSAAEADVVVTGTYVTIGKVFSVDALAKTTGGRTITRAFVQGESQDELIPAVGKLAEKLSAELAKVPADGAAPILPAATIPVSKANGPSEIIRQGKEEIRKVPEGEIIRQEPKQTRTSASGEKGWISKQLPGAAQVLAVGATLPDGSREIFLGQNNRVLYFRQGEVMKLMATVDFMATEKVISVDKADADGDGRQVIYITVVRSGELASQVWEVQGDRLVKIAGDLPYYFHAISLGGGPNRLYLQEMSRDADFYGPVYEASRTGTKITKKGPIKMPRYGNIYNYNQFRDRDGNQLSVVIGSDNHLIVYNKDLKEIWRSNDKYGGTDLYFLREDENVRVTGEQYRKIYLEMRIHVTAGNEIMVGKNDGTFVVGNARLYKKGAVYCFEWDGSSLDELWRTREVQNYMPDYWFDAGRKELLMLLMPLKPGPGEDGTAALAIKKVE